MYVLNISDISSISKIVLLISCLSIFLRAISFEGFVKVEHDGSSESCSLRNPLQECHIRIILETTSSGNVIAQDVMFDDTFRSNELVFDFDLVEMEFEDGEGLQIRLETDQIRDWHKPTAEWSNTAPVSVI